MTGPYTVDVKVALSFTLVCIIIIFAGVLIVKDVLKSKEDWKLRNKR